MLPAKASYYKNNVIISKFEDLDCAHYYKLNSCIKSVKFCTFRITSDYVANVINKDL